MSTGLFSYSQTANARTPLGIHVGRCLGRAQLQESPSPLKSSRKRCQTAAPRLRVCRRLRSYRFCRLPRSAPRAIHRQFGAARHISPRSCPSSPCAPPSGTGCRARSRPPADYERVAPPRESTGSSAARATRAGRRSPSPSPRSPRAPVPAATGPKKRSERPRASGHS